MKRAVKSIRHIFNSVVLLYSSVLASLLILKTLGQDQRWWVGFLVNFMPLYFLPMIVLAMIGLVLRVRLALLSATPLVLLGIVLYGPAFLPKTSCRRYRSFRVITFNASEDNSMPDQVMSWLCSQSAQLILLQEVSTDWFSRLQRELSAQYPFQNLVLTEKGTRGNVILSHYPIVSLFPSTEAVPVVQQITVDIEGRYISVYNVSLWAPVADSDRTDLASARRLWELILSYDERERNAQIACLLRTVSKSANPFLVAGDFNMSEASSIYGTIAAQMADSFREAGVGLGNTWPVIRASQLGSIIPPLLRLDYIWHSGDFETVSAAFGPQLGSDHLPVIANLHFRDK